MIIGVEPVELSLPILGMLPNGDYSLGVPVMHDALQVGFRGKPDTIGRISVHVESEAITIAREDGEALQIEGNFATADTNGRLAIERRMVFREPVEAITLTPSETYGKWTVEGDVLDVGNRVGLSRFAAKVGETVLNRQKLPQHRQAA